MENRINHIIARVLSGESSSDDILSLSEWLNENEKNRDEFRRLKNYWDADVAFKHSVAPALSADKLQQKINVQRRQTARRQLWRNAIPLIAAACLLFIFSTAFFLYNTKDRTSEYYTLLTDEHTSNFTLEDGTVITLNKNSRLSYSDKYGKDNRNVKLEGEAYFEVAKDSNKPFQVEMNGASITVLGTHFNVKADAESDDITATLVEGSIRFEGAKQNIVMTPNQQLTFNRSTNKVDVKEIDTETFTAWKDGLLKYKSIPFIELIENLKDIYQVEIRIDDERLADPSITVSGTFDQKQSIEQILKVISHSLPIRWTNKTGNYHIQHAH
ncbi:FecR family protein [Parabacteroides merdae]|uniref:DUF4974 domain-containing protein n=1 Tax=Parabacteroides merdae TaxID=46503 RepID=A0A7K1H9E0_9BACT|nr:FecR domain-containing protein [Parabacteroides merdae]MTU27758.1 DUF4974 domain-containing protein [Parabacteroides merdae]RYS85772.1 DUF4974 domain-containing protein [Parabacteroides merdae]